MGQSLSVNGWLAIYMRESWVWRREGEERGFHRNKAGRSIVAYDSRQYYKLKATLEFRKSIHMIQIEGRWRELVFGPRAFGSACLAIGMDLAIEINYYLLRKSHILGQGIVQSGLVPINYPYTVLTSVVEMKPKGTC